MQRRSVAIEGKWPSGFKSFIERHWNMQFDDKPVKLMVSYLDMNLNDEQKEKFKKYIFSRVPEKMHEWFISIIPRLYAQEIPKEWIEAQDFVKGLKAECGLKIVLVINFPCETEIIPLDKYPLAFVLAEV